MSRENTLLQHIQPFWQEVADAVSILNSQQAEIERIDHYMDNVIDNMFVASADRTLPRFEKTFGHLPEPSDTFQVRREKVVSLMRSNKQVTVETLKNIVASFTHGDVVVEEIPLQHLVRVRFVSLVGIPSKIANVRSAIRAALPAHIGLEMEFLYASYRDVGDNYPSYQSISTTKIAYLQLLLADQSAPSAIDFKSELRLELTRYINESKSLMLGSGYVGYQGLN